MAMNDTTHELLDLFLPDQYNDTAQSMWQPGTSPTYQEFAHAQQEFNTVSPRDLTVQSRASRHLPATAPPQSHRPAHTSHAASIKSSSHISTPALTPQTTNGNCSTPETSIEGGDEDQHAVVQSRLAAESPHKYKTILPAPPKYSSGENAAPLATNLPERPRRAFYARPHDAFFPGVFQRELLPANPLAADDLTGVGQADPDPILIDLPWLAPNTNNDKNVFADINALFNFDDNEDIVGSQMIGPTYPPIPDDSINTSGFLASTTDLSNSHFTSDPFLPSYPVETEFPLLDNADSRPYTGIIGTDAVLVVDYVPQGAEAGVPSTQYGEGSRRDTSRDLELLELRSQGISYREIKQKYGFAEAESTLRGRYRTLTKSKDKRVRKPIWKDEDIRLLCTVVWELAKQQGLCSETRRVRDWPVLASEQTLNKVSWKKVTQEMERRGSYPYGFTTTKKKYFDVARGKG